MPDFSSIIQDAYQEILRRAADPGGLSFYNGQMNQGLTEASLREGLLRSPEYAQKFPDSFFTDRIGMNVHVSSNRILEDVAVNLAIPWVRVDFDWFRMEPARGRFEWAETDRVIQESSRLGLQVLATLAYTPAWASSNPASPLPGDPPAETRFWTDFVGASVNRYRNRVRHWQFWNEPNLREFWNGTMQQWRVSIFEPGALTAKGIDPQAQVVAPGLANVGQWRDWFEEAMLSKNLIQVVNHHNYASTGRQSIVELRTDQLFRPSLRTLMEENGVANRPFWLTETGRRTESGDQPRYYAEILETMRTELWVSRLFFFHYTDGPGQGNAGFGIVNADLTPKPVYFVLRSVTNSAARPT